MKLKVTIKKVDDLLSRGELSKKLRVYFNEICNKLEEHFVGNTLFEEIYEDGKEIGKYKIVE